MSLVEKSRSDLVPNNQQQNEQKSEHHLHIHVWEKSDDAKNRQPKHLKDSIQVHLSLRNLP